MPAGELLGSKATTSAGAATEANQQSADEMFDRKAATSAGDAPEAGIAQRQVARILATIT
jgi:hypothetical protein